MLLLGLALVTRTAHATSGIPCTSADQRFELTVQISLTEDGAGNGVTAVRLRQPGQDAGVWTVTRATADYRRQMLRLSARHGASASPSVPPSPALQLRIQRDHGTLQLGKRRVPLVCDWGEFS